jgi:hypothetical protein
LALFLFGAQMATDWLGREKPEDKPADKPADKPTQDASQDELLAKMRKSFEEVVAPIREKVESFDSRIEEIKTATARPAPKIENVEIPSVMDGDEDGAFAARLAPLQTTVAQINGQLIEDRVVSDMNAQGWGEIIPELRETLAKVHPMYKAAKDYDTTVRKVADGIIGTRARSKGLKADPTKKTYYFAEDAGATGKSDNVVRVTPEDQRLMDKLGIPESKREEFMKQARPA